MSNFTIMATCQQLRQELVNAQVARDKASAELEKAKADLQAEIDKAYTPGFKGTPEQLEYIERLRLLLGIAAKRVKEAENAVIAAEAAWRKSELSICAAPSPCVSNLTFDFFQINVDDQTTDVTKEQQDLQKIRDEIVELRKIIDDLKGCSVARQTTIPPKDIKFHFTNKYYIINGQPVAIQAFLDAINSDECLYANEKSKLIGLLNTNGKAAFTDGSSVIKGLNKQAANAYNDINSGVLDRIKEEIARFERDLQRALREEEKLEIYIADALSPMSAMNRTKKSEMIQKALEIAIGAIKGLKYSNDVTVTAVAGPNAQSSGGASKTLKDHSSVSIDVEGNITLDAAKAAAELPKPGGCGVPNALWVHPITVSAVVTANFEEIKQKIQTAAATQLKAINFKANGPDGTITFTGNGNSVTLTGCVGAPKKISN